VSQQVTYDDIVNFARGLRKKLFKYATYYVVQKALEALSPSVTGKLFEAPTALRLDSARTVHESAPTPTFAILDPSTMNPYVDIGVSSPAGAQVIVDTESAFNEYQGARVMRFAPRYSIQAYVKTSTKEAVFGVSGRWRTNYEIYLAVANFVYFNYPEGHDPREYTTDTEARYRFAQSGTMVEVKDKLAGDDIDVSIYVLLGDFIAYYDANELLVGADGAKIIIYNYEDEDIEVVIPRLFEEVVGAGEIATKYITGVFTALELESV